MEQLILHLFGDYFLQNEKIAINKRKKAWKGFGYCLLHCLLYSIPFLLITNLFSVILIFVFHFILDRYSLLTHLIRLKNFEKDTENFGYPKSTKRITASVLYTIQDNTFHLIINYFIILFFG